MAQAHGAEVMGHHDENADVQTPSSGPSPTDAYQKEMGELKTLMQKTLEQKGVLAKMKVGQPSSHWVCSSARPSSAWGRGAWRPQHEQPLLTAPRHAR